MLKLDKICVSFRRECQDKLFGHTKQQVLFDVSAEVKKGTCLGILGESGSGKSTMGRVLCGLLKPDSGTVFLNGISVYGSKRGRKNLQDRLSIVFQDYTTSANPRFRVADILKEGLFVRQRRERKKLNQEDEIRRLLELVGDKRPCQRPHFHHVAAPAGCLDPRIGRVFIKLLDVRPAPLGGGSKLEVRHGFALIGMQGGNALGIRVPRAPDFFTDLILVGQVDGQHFIEVAVDDCPAGDEQAFLRVVVGDGRKRTIRQQRLVGEARAEVQPLRIELGEGDAVGDEHLRREFTAALDDRQDEL